MWAPLNRWHLLEETRAQLLQSVERPSQLSWQEEVWADRRSALDLGDGLVSIHLSRASGSLWTAIKPTDLAGDLR